MKYKILIYTLFVGMLSACNPDEFLDVYPTGSTIPTTIEDFDKILENPAVTADATGTNLSYMDPDVFIPENIFNGYNSVMRLQYRWDDQPYNDESFADDDWNDRYNHIMTYNTMLADIDNADTGSRSEADRLRVKGEALAQRSFDFFLLLTEYGAAYNPNNLDAPGIPMPLEVDLTAQLSRSTVGEVYDQIEKDLDMAESLLADADPINQAANFRPGIASIYGLQALVALTKGDFSKADTYADLAISKYNFIYDYTTATNNTAGNAWSGISFDEMDYSTTTKNVIWNREHRDDYFRDAVFFSNDLLSIFDTNNDQRYLLFNSDESYTGASYGSNTVFATYKRTIQAGLTTPDLYLISAEAKIREGNRSEALDRLNTLLEKRILNFTPYDVADFTDDASVLALVKNERRKELMASGKNFLDQKRYVAYGETVPTFVRTISGQTYELTPDQESYMVPISLNIQSLNLNLN